MSADKEKPCTNGCGKPVAPPNENFCQTCLDRIAALSESMQEMQIDEDVVTECNNCPCLSSYVGRCGYETFKCNHLYGLIRGPYKLDEIPDECPLRTRGPLLVRIGAADGAE
jgi:hypothetical protein